MTVRASRSAATTARPPASCTRAMTALGSHTRPEAPGYWMKAPNASGSSAGSTVARSCATSSMPSAAARLSRSARVCGRASASMRKTGVFAFEARRASSMPSTTAVASSSMDAFAVARPESSATIVWKLMSASSRPCEISGWYGV
ncbi:hypothetical protein BC477_01920 [Clavibacter michiganensis subsp. michiganensis]|uniref:Uncharacterized protein n=1 Tax=Clavibacter michiganensis subsp. michiganensis TaxID=33013 RepID=A0A251XJ73_CLAMM|nr:hypothetical protein BC477_01920 [Clavibacter michiganensis subsp. michiganensis]OUE03466.1 hypothetical protein CMMCAS07_00855 [Clavibacter michiganensis subsp. michiganensis]